MNGYGSAVRTADDFFVAQPFEGNNEMKRLNCISTVKALYEHCINIEISEPNLFVGRNIGNV